MTMRLNRIIFLAFLAVCFPCLAAGEMFHAVSDWGLTLHDFDGSTFSQLASEWVGANARAVRLNDYGDIVVLSDWGILVYTYAPNLYTPTDSAWAGTPKKMALDSA